MRSLIVSSFLYITGLPLGAAPVEVEVFGDQGSWVLPGGMRGVPLEKGRAAAISVPVPPLTDKEKDAPGKWQGILSVDAYGTTTGAKGSVILEALDPRSGEVFAKGEAVASGVAPKDFWAVIASSSQEGADAGRAFDGNPATDWHTKHGAAQPPPPHWIGLEFGTPQALEGIRYLPRQGGYANGVAKNYRFEIRGPGKVW